MPIIRTENRSYYKVTRSGSHFLEIYTDEMEGCAFTELYDCGSQPDEEWHLATPHYSLRLV